MFYINNDNSNRFFETLVTLDVHMLNIKPIYYSGYQVLTDATPEQIKFINTVI